MPTLLNQKRLKEVLKYNPLTGLFTWVNNIDVIAGHLNKKGYIEIKLDGVTYLAHRLAFLYMEGYFPEHDVDHEKGIRHDNRWVKIRHASRSCNMQNQKINNRNTSGFMGVSWSSANRNWRSYIKINGKQINLGRYEDHISAALARCHYEECCPNWNCNSRAVNRIKLRRLGYKV